MYDPLPDAPNGSGGMTPDEAFLQSIIERPEDDGPRLVYADWLEENGRPERAEFIRVQIRLAALDGDDPAFRPLRKRELALHREHGEAWKASLPPLPASVVWGKYRRGFIEEVRASADSDLRSVTDAILTAIPLRRLMLADWQHADSLAGSPLLARTRELVLHRSWIPRPSPPLDDPLIAAVLSWSEAQQLTHLELRRLQLSEVGVGALAGNLAGLESFRWEDVPGYPTRSLEPLLAAHWLQRLERLELGYLTLTGGLMRRLCANLTPGRLRRLVVRGASLTDADAADLAASRVLAGLEVLDLENNDIGSAGIAALVEALPPTARLLLGRNAVGDEGLEALAASPLLARLVELPGGRYGDRGVRAIAESLYAGRLFSINLAQHQVGSAGAKALLTSPRLTALKGLYFQRNQIDSVPACGLETLKDLRFGGNPFGRSALREFCADSHLPALERLDLDGCGLGPEAAQQLADAPGFPALKHLILNGNPLGDAGAAALAAGRGLPALEELHLWDCRIGDKGVLAWMDSPRLVTLKRIALTNPDGNPISKEVYEAFRDAAWRRGCDVDHRSRKPPPLRSLRRGRTGLATAEDRVNLVRWIDRLRFAVDYHAGRLQAVAFEDLRKDVDEPDDLRLLDQYRRGERVDDGLRQEMIRLFLRERVNGRVPESVGKFQSVTRAEALSNVESVIAASLEEERPAIRGPVPQYVAADRPAVEVEDPDDVGTVPYPQLRTWFADELFDPAEVAYFVHAEVRFDTWDPRVVGMDRDVIAMLWLD